MKQLFALASLTLLCSAAQADDFARRAALTLTGSGPYHQVVLPLSVYDSVRRPDLGDVRVLNGKGAEVPYALVAPRAADSAKTTELAAPVFPIVGNSGSSSQAAPLNVDVRRSGDDTLVAVRQGAASKGEQVRGIVVDLSQAPAGTVHGLRLALGASKAPFAAFTLETSDDLQQWRTLRDDGQIAALEHQGQRIGNTDVTWIGSAGKYLRLLWAAPDEAPAVTGAQAISTVTARGQLPLVWTAPIQASVPNASKGAFDFSLGGQIPLERVRILFAEENSLAPVSLSEAVSERGPNGLRERWVPIAQTVAYRLRTPAGSVRSPDLLLGRGPAQRLRVSFDERSGAPAEGTTLQVGFTPASLVFLARGEGPFTLAWGSSSAQPGWLDVATLMPGYREDAALPASVASVGPVQGAAPAAAPAPATQAGPAKMSPAALWAILLAGVAVLGGMAFMLFKQMKAQAK